MWNRTALLVAVLAFALPAIADQPPQPAQKNAHPIAPKAPKNLKGQKVGTHETEKMSATFSDPTINAGKGQGNIGSGSWGKPRSGSSQGIKHKPKPANTGAVNLKEAAPPPK